MTWPFGRSRSCSVVADVAREGHPPCDDLLHVAGTVLAPLGLVANELRQVLSGPGEVARIPEEVEQPRVAAGQAEIAVEGHQALADVLERGLQHRGLLRQLALSPLGHLEQARVVQRDGRLSGERGHQPDVLVGVRVRLHVAVHEEAVDTVAEDDGRGDQGAGRRARGHHGSVVRGIVERRIGQPVVGPAHAPLREGPPADALARPDSKGTAEVGRRVVGLGHDQAVLGRLPAIEAGPGRLHGLDGALGHDLEDLLAVQGGRQAPRHVVQRAGLALPALGLREQPGVADGHGGLSHEGVQEILLPSPEARRAWRRPTTGRR